MSPPATLDSSALIAYLNGEPGAKIVDALSRNPTTACQAHALNLYEVYYNAVRSADEIVARQVVAELLSAGVNEWRDMGRQFWFRVGGFKARGRITLADCGLTLAEKLSGSVVTADHLGFNPSFRSESARSYSCVDRSPCADLRYRRSTSPA